MKNHQTNVLSSNLKKAAKDNEAALWARLAKELNRPNRISRAVNVAKLEKYADDAFTIVVPGKVLGAGILQKPVKVAGFSFSQQAIDKIKKAKGTVMSIEELLKKNPKAQKVKIIG